MRAIRYQAAGGVVVDPAGDQVLVLRRPSRDEVRLPKGHLKKQESAPQAALREVQEESGYTEPEVLADLGQQTVEFDYQGDHIIREEQYFLMRLRSTHQGSQEVQFTPQWLDWDAALEEMSFEAEREWLRRAQSALEGLRHRKRGA
jgi:8-oxo-dGTP pyrophosphatase MutT (NUDIX family)